MINAQQELAEAEALLRRWVKGARPVATYGETVEFLRSATPPDDAVVWDERTAEYVNATPDPSPSEPVSEEELRSIEAHMAYYPNVSRPMSQSSIRRLIADLRQAREAIADRDDMARITLAGGHPDEKHCTCVPDLRARIAELERYVAAWERADEKHLGLLAQRDAQITTLASDLDMAEDGQRAALAKLSETRTEVDRYQRDILAVVGRCGRLETENERLREALEIIACQEEAMEQ